MTEIIVENNYILRRYISSDIEGILNVFKNSVNVLCSKDYSPSQLKAWSDCADRDKWNEQFLSRHTTVAETEGKIIGFCDIESNGHLDRLYVSGEYAHIGVGKALVKDAESAVKTKFVFVEASITAKPFFEKLGYKTLEKQTVTRHGETLTNYRMIKEL